MSKCVLCNAPARTSIEKAVATNKLSMTAAAKRLGCNRASISRHMRDHVPAKVQKAANTLEAHEGLDVLTQVIDSHKIVWNIIIAAYKDGDMKTALAGIDTETRQLKLAALVSGQLSEQPQVNILMDAQYLEFQAFIVQALDKFPEARLALSAALDREDRGSADD
jgi:hypothetical protein